MGNLCTRTTSYKYKSSVADPVSGLSLKEIDLIKHLWVTIHENAEMVDTAVIFFTRLFDKYPYMKDYFYFSCESSPTGGNIPAFRAHAISVFAEMAKYLDYIEDPELLVALIKKRTRGHYVYGVTRTDMEILKEMFLEFLKDRGMGMVQLPEAIAAWDKFLTLHNIIFANKIGELVDKRIFSEATLEIESSSDKKSTDLIEVVRNQTEKSSQA